MTREDPPLRIRLPAELKQQIQDLAAKSRRSMNAEIVSRLEATIAQGLIISDSGFDAPASSGTDMEQRVNELLNRVASLEKALQMLTINSDTYHLENRVRALEGKL